MSDLVVSPKDRVYFSDASHMCFCFAAKQVSRGKRGRSFSEGWVEFKNKKVAKSVAASLNNTQIGGEWK